MSANFASFVSNNVITSESVSVSHQNVEEEPISLFPLTTSSDVANIDSKLLSSTTAVHQFVSYIFDNFMKIRNYLSSLRKNFNHHLGIHTLVTI